MHIMQAPGVGAIAADGGSIDEPIARRDSVARDVVPQIGILFPGRRIRDVPDLGQGLRVVAAEIPRVVPARQAYSHSASVGSR